MCHCFREMLVPLNGMHMRDAKLSATWTSFSSIPTPDHSNCIISVNMHNPSFHNVFAQLKWPTVLVTFLGLNAISGSGRLYSFNMKIFIVSHFLKYLFQARQVTSMSQNYLPGPRTQRPEKWEFKPRHYNVWNLCWLRCMTEHMCSHITLQISTIWW